MNIHDIPIPELVEKFHDKWVICQPFSLIFSDKLWHSIQHKLESRGIIALRACDQWKAGSNMTSQAQTFRIFVSSAFSDLQKHGYSIQRGTAIKPGGKMRRTTNSLSLLRQVLKWKGGYLW